MASPPTIVVRARSGRAARPGRRRHGRARDREARRGDTSRRSRRDSGGEGRFGRVVEPGEARRGRPIVRREGVPGAGRLGRRPGEARGEHHLAGRGRRAGRRQARAAVAGEGIEAGATVGRLRSRCGIGTGGGRLPRRPDAAAGVFAPASLAGAEAVVFRGGMRRGGLQRRGPAHPGCGQDQRADDRQESLGVEMGGRGPHGSRAWVAVSVEQATSSAGPRPLSRAGAIPAPAPISSPTLAFRVTRRVP